MDHCRKAADIIASLLTDSISEAEQEGRHLFVWEREGIEWLRKQWEIDPGSQINLWIAHRYVQNKGLDLHAKASPDRKP